MKTLFIRLARVLALLLLLLSLLFAYLAYHSYQLIHQPLQQERQFDVLYGDSVIRFANNLKYQNVFDYPQLVVLASRLYRLTALKAGEYQITADMSLMDLLSKVNRGDVIAYNVTLVEGHTVKQAVKQLQQSLGVVSTMAELDQASLLRAMGADTQFSHAEGLLSADTYRYIKGTKDKTILRKAHQQLLRQLEQAWQQAQKNNDLPYQSAYELLIMASIIERETSVAAERRQVAGVFVQRLKKGMRLQTDPTVIYGMGDAYQGKITRKDLRTKTPYNTYTISGLPPTPIALVSQASLAAAADPLLNDKLYFVAKGDGYHYFSATLAEHEQAVTRYQRQRRKDYRSTPEVTP